MRVLIVDDASFMRKVLADLVEKNKHEVVGQAKDGEEAVKAFEMLNPDLVLMDVIMPEKSGLEAVKQIKKMDPTALIVVISATGKEEIVKNAVSLGAIGFIKKPPDEDKFSLMLAKIAEMSAKRGPGPELARGATFMLREVYNYTTKYFGPVTASTFHTKVKEYVVDRDEVEIRDEFIVYIEGEEGEVVKIIGGMLDHMRAMLSDLIGEVEGSEIMREVLKIGYHTHGTEAFGAKGMPQWLRDEVAEIERATSMARKDLLTSKYGLTGGKVYIIAEKKPMRSYAIFKAMKDSGAPGMCISRTSPNEVVTKYNLGEVERIWLTFNEVKEIICIEPTNTSMLFNRISRFLGDNPSGTIILDGFEYIMTHNNFNTAHKFINAIHDEAMLSKGVVIVPLDMQVLEEKQVRLIERELAVVNPDQ
jgi:two-component system chemotaxis response regulator CheY